MRTLVAITIAMLCGCSTIQQVKQDKALLLNAEQLTPSTITANPAYTAQVTACANASRLARPNYDDPPAIPSAPNTVAAYVAECSAVQMMYCGQWLDRVSNASRLYAIGAKDVSIAEALGTTLMGLMNAPGKAVAVVGALETGLAGFGDAINQAVFTAPSAGGVRSKVMEQMTAYRKQLVADANDDELSYADAFIRLNELGHFCTYPGIQAAVDASMQATQPAVDETGALKLVPR